MISSTVSTLNSSIDIGFEDFPKGMLPEIIISVFSQIINFLRVY